MISAQHFTPSSKLPHEQSVTQDWVGQVWGAVEVVTGVAGIGEQTLKIQMFHFTQIPGGTVGRSTVPGTTVPPMSTYKGPQLVL